MFSIMQTFCGGNVFTKILFTGSSSPETDFIFSPFTYIIVCRGHKAAFFGQTAARALTCGQIFAPYMTAAVRLSGSLAKSYMDCSGAIRYNKVTVDRSKNKRKGAFAMCSIGEKIAELRRERKMTQEELANMIGVSSQSVSKWENNVTMPDIVLLPIIAGIFEVTVDELFSVETKSRRDAAPVEETPLAVYDAVLETMWAWDESGGSVEKIKSNLMKNESFHSGFVSMTRGGVYADRNLALSYIADSASSAELLNSEGAAGFLNALSSPDLRTILKYQLENRGVSYTASSVAVKCGIAEENAKRALDLMVKYAIARKDTVDMGTGERIDIYSHFGDHKLTLLIYPILSLAEQLSDFKENWCGFRA